MTIKIAHVLKNRVRFKFDFQIEFDNFKLMHDCFIFCFPHYSLHRSFQGYGCVVQCSEELCLPIEILNKWFIEFFNTENLYGPYLPPSLWQQRKKKMNHIFIQVMMFFAIMGWILPIMPGTPFFLIAWSIGWRPPNSKHTIEPIRA